MYTHETCVTLHDTDASGLIYFAHLPRMAHVAFETYLETEGLGVAGILAAEDFLLPIVHVEADYRAAIRLGDRLTIALTSGRAGHTSISLSFRFLNADGKEVATVRSVHVSIDFKTRKKIPVPDRLRRALADLD